MKSEMLLVEWWLSKSQEAKAAISQITQVLD